MNPNRARASVSWLVLLLALLILADARPAAAGNIPELPGLESRVTAAANKPFRLPFADPPGPNTWLLGQTYGNTTGAYRQRKTTYGEGQGIHFGIDFSAPCKTPLVSIGDGTVLVVDEPWRYGSAPHNLLIEYPNGYVALYGHIFETPKLKVGQKVKAGEVVALSGDPDETCHSRPHLHLEIRDYSLGRAVNPVNLIDADWDSLAMTGQFGRGFEKDLDDPRRWQSLEDQPEIEFGRPLINDFTRAWPNSAGVDR